MKKYGNLEFGNPNILFWEGVIWEGEFRPSQKKSKDAAHRFFWGGPFFLGKNTLRPPSVIFGSQWGPQLETKISKNGGWEGIL